jgi:hypothetical protein
MESLIIFLKDKQLTLSKKIIQKKLLDCLRRTVTENADQSNSPVTF